MKELLIGLDMGTQGVRAVAVDSKGDVMAMQAKNYDQINLAEEPYKEQSAFNWKDTAFRVLAALSDELRSKDILSDKVVIAVDGTSGTIVPIDAHGNPLTNGLMYNNPLRRIRLLDCLRYNLSGGQTYMLFRKHPVDDP